MTVYAQLKVLVDEFSNLADEKKVYQQMALFTENAQVTTYIDGKIFADVTGRKQIEQVFSEFLAQFDAVYHLNGQFCPNVITENYAEAIHYCSVKLTSKENGKHYIHEHSVRYLDEYVYESGKWLIAKRLAYFLISEKRELIG